MEQQYMKYSEIHIREKKKREREPFSEGCTNLSYILTVFSNNQTINVTVLSARKETPAVGKRGASGNRQEHN